MAFGLNNGSASTTLHLDRTANACGVRAHRSRRRIRRGVTVRWRRRPSSRRRTARSVASVTSSRFVSDPSRARLLRNPGVTMYWEPPAAVGTVASVS